MRTAKQLLAKKWHEKLLVCVGLDTDPSKIPSHILQENLENETEAMLDFNIQIIDETKDIVLGYKINSAFYEKYGPEGMMVFEETCEYIKKVAPKSFLIKDIKRGDIGNTNVGYAEYLKNADAITISGYFGEDANEPFLAEEFKDKLIIVLAKTSNKGSAEIQDLVAEGLPVYLHMAKNVMRWGKYNNCAFVVGGTHPNHLLQVRSIVCSDGIILVPGVGAQGGDLKQVIINGTNQDGTGVIINLSRSVIYASNDKDFAEKARKEVLRVNQEIAEYLMLPRVYWENVRDSFYEEKTFEILAKANAVLKNDHFVYQAGHHGPAYVAKDKVTINPLAIDEIGRMLADLMKDQQIETVAVPAVGGIVLGHIVAKYLSHFKGKIIHSVFLEKDVNSREIRSGKPNKFIITRGYEEYIYGKNVAILEDILNSGHSVKNVLECIENAYGNVTTVGVICNRGGVEAKDLGENIMLFNLSVLDLEKYNADKCPLCANGVLINTQFGHGKKFLEEQKK